MTETQHGAQARPSVRQMLAEDVPTLHRFYLEDPYGVTPSQIRGQDWLRKVVDDDEQVRLTIVAPDGAVAGAVTLWWYLREEGVACPTMWVGRAFRRQGLGRFALNALLTHAHLERPAVRKVLASVCEHNVASRALCDAVFDGPEAALRRQTFHDGRWWDTVFYSTFLREGEK